MPLSTSPSIVMHSPDTQRVLLRLARETAQRALTGDETLASQKPSVPQACGGVFVTFWNGSTLRGCVGTFAPHADIADAVVDATHAALDDPRFEATPITGSELPRLNIEISILSTPARTNDPLSLVPGKHGIIVRHGDRSGCFLPKVANERGWSAEEFLSHCCRMKAGLPADAWRRPDTEVLLFTAQAFSEAEFAAPRELLEQLGDAEESFPEDAEE